MWVYLKLFIERLVGKGLAREDLHGWQCSTPFGLRICKTRLFSARPVNC
jgi:hypothetical protein